MPFVRVKIRAVDEETNKYNLDKWMYCTINTNKIEYFYQCQNGTTNIVMDSGDELNVLLDYIMLSNLIHNNN